MDFHHIMMLIHHKLYDSYKLYYCRKEHLCIALYSIVLHLQTIARISIVLLCIALYSIALHSIANNCTDHHCRPHHSLGWAVHLCNRPPSWIEFLPKNEKSKKLLGFRQQTGPLDDIYEGAGYYILLRTFALTSVDLSTPRSRRNVRGQVWLHTSLCPIWFGGTFGPWSKISFLLWLISHIELFVKETCLTRMVTNFQSRRQPGTWLLILLTSCFTCKWVDMLVNWMVGAPTIAGTSWARLLERARLNPISAFPLCCSNGTKALVLP